MSECPSCKKDIDSDNIPVFTDEMECPYCKALLEVDWEYIDAYEGLISSWIVGVKKRKADNEG